MQIGLLCHVLTESLRDSGDLRACRRTLRVEDDIAVLVGKRGEIDARRKYGEICKNDSVWLAYEHAYKTLYTRFHNGKTLVSTPSITWLAKFPTTAEVIALSLGSSSTSITKVTISTRSTTGILQSLREMGYSSCISTPSRIVKTSSI